MNKKFFISTAVVFVAMMALSMLFHGYLLGDEYKAMMSLFRGEEESKQYFPFMLVAHLIMSGALVWVYRQGKTGQPFMIQGLRFGIAMALVSSVPFYLIYYAVQPMPGILVAKQIIFDLISMMTVGVIVAKLESN